MAVINLIMEMKRAVSFKEEAEELRPQPPPPPRRAISVFEERLRHVGRWLRVCVVAIALLLVLFGMIAPQLYSMLFRGAQPPDHDMVLKLVTELRRDPVFVGALEQWPNATSG